MPDTPAATPRDWEAIAHKLAEELKFKADGKTFPRFRYPEQWIAWAEEELKSA